LSSGFPPRSISRGRSRAVARSPEAPRGRARRWPAACRPISIFEVVRDVVEPGAVIVLQSDHRRHRCRPTQRPWREAVRRRRGWGFALLATRLPRRRACRSAALSGWGDAMSGNAELRLSIVTVTFRGGLGRSIRLVVLLGLASSSLFGVQRPFFVGRLRSGSRRARKGVKGAACRLAQLGFRSALTPEHTARVREIARCSIPLSVSS
jgi:hypothetical protein